ncbi:hypothetical protein NPIL_145571 [Nephila pilipes]|uniref:Uncharacterized protein n=1 Tax=Nephila pilipes TaxID=299642 RepID=A0A8X6U762_NEPPI|nr:hypothetical protein NPIL_427331 [Nephila pilipes]GFT98852.1 hypothetical protein NPIL_145571 [Nephila pilipes]
MLGDGGCQKAVFQETRQMAEKKSPSCGDGVYCRREKAYVLLIAQFESRDWFAIIRGISAVMQGDPHYRGPIP